MPGDSRAQELLKRQQELENNRSVLDAHMKEVAERVLPRQNIFQQSPSSHNEGEKRTERVFDSTALLALDRGASAVDSLVTPSTQTYQRLEPEDERLLGDKATMVYCDELNKRIFRMRYRPRANFASQTHECFVGLLAFGTLGMFVDDELGYGTMYKSISMAELYIAENAAGLIDYNHRKFMLSARQAKQKFKRLPEKIEKASQNEPFKKFEFLHCVKPNDGQMYRLRNFRGMAFSSFYVSYEGEEVVSEGGYRTLPYAVSRHVTAPNETYGRSPAMMVLPDIKMVNEMEKTTIRAAHKIVDPPLMAYGDGILAQFNARPSAVNYGAVDEQGRQLVHPLKTGANIPIVIEMTEQKRKVINDAFYVTLFQILVQNPQMTATEALIRAQEKGQLLAPTVGRQQGEFLGSITPRELDILEMSGQLPEMPPKLIQAGGRLKVVYTSPLTRLRRAEEGVAIIRTIEQIAPLAEVKPEILDNFDEDVLTRELSEINGVPAKVMRAVEAVAEIRAARAQAQKEAADMAQAEQVSKIAAQGAKAEQLSQQPA